MLCVVFELLQDRREKKRKKEEEKKKAFCILRPKGLFGLFRIISNVNQSHDFHPVTSIQSSAACVRDAKHSDMMTGKEKRCIWLKHS